MLDRLGVAATFFVLPRAVAADRRGWRAAVEQGHEIGNHTVTHPCSGNFAWSRDNALEGMTLAAFTAEIAEANRRLRDLLDVEPAVFAYPCGHTHVGRGFGAVSLVPTIAELFVAGRTFNDVTANFPSAFDPAQVACVASDAKTYVDLEPMLEATLADGAWLVLGGHEIGDAATPETTTLATIEAVVRWGRAHNVWIDTVGAVACAISSS